MPKAPARANYMLFYFLCHHLRRREPIVPQGWTNYVARRMQVRLSGHC
jgi:hypothetical protein